MPLVRGYVKEGKEFRPAFEGEAEGAIVVVNNLAQYLFTAYPAYGVFGFEQDGGEDALDAFQG